MWAVLEGRVLLRCFEYWETTEQSITQASVQCVCTAQMYRLLESIKVCLAFISSKSVRFVLIATIL